MENFLKDLKPYQLVSLVVGVLGLAVILVFGAVSCYRTDVEYQKHRNEMRQKESETFWKNK